MTVVGNVQNLKDLEDDKSLSLGLWLDMLVSWWIDL